MKLSVLQSGARVHEFVLIEGRALIGRWDPESGSFPEIDLEGFDPDAKVSRKHAFIEVRKGRVTLEDVGSLNGTFINRGERVATGDKIELKFGDEIVIGKTFLRLESE